MNILLRNDKDVSIFLNKNNYDGTKFTQIWNPHITIAGIRNPTEDYCRRKNLNSKEWINESFKHMKRYIDNIVSDTPIHVTKLENSIRSNKK